MESIFLTTHKEASSGSPIVTSTRDATPVIEMDKKAIKPMATTNVNFPDMVLIFYLDFFEFF
jgi:hypothetical protein